MSIIKEDYVKKIESNTRLRDKYKDAGNEIFFSFSDQISSLSTFFLGFIGVWFSVNKEGLTNSNFLKAFFIFSIVLFIASIIFGLWTKLETNKFFHKVANACDDFNKDLCNYLKSTDNADDNFIEQLRENKFKRLNESLFPWQLKVQITLFSLSLLFLLLLLFKAFVF